MITYYHILFYTIRYSWIVLYIDDLLFWLNFLALYQRSPGSVGGFFDGHPLVNWRHDARWKHGMTMFFSIFLGLPSGKHTKSY